MSHLIVFADSVCRGIRSVGYLPEIAEKMRAAVRDGARYALVTDDAGRIIDHAGQCPWHRLADLGIGQEFTVRGRRYTYRVGGPGCYTSVSYAAGKHGVHVVLPVFNAAGKPTLIKIKPTDHVFLEV